MKKIAIFFKTRFEALRADETGMEAAQVILILAIVVAILVPIILKIVNTIATKGSSVNTCIGGVTTTGSC